MDQNNVMNTFWTFQSGGVFLLVIAATFIVALIGRKHTSHEKEAHMPKQKLNRWLVGLSAGATANSGFVVTGAVGLGYSHGLYWLLLPFGWLIGDLIYWKYFPRRLTLYARKSNSSTLADLITHDLGIKPYHPLVLASTLILVVCMGGYTMAQWKAGQKFLDGAFGMSKEGALILFSILIISYTSIGRFRGSVYVDCFQAITRMLGTLTVMISIIIIILREPSSFLTNISGTDSAFLNILGTSSIFGAISFMLGYSAAALGFGLGQPQVTSRYFAAKNSRETRAAKWIYIGYVQLTWMTMTIFGILLRGVMPEIEDPEVGLTVFVSSVLPPLLVGLIVADIFGAIASTANSLLVAMAQATRDLLGRSFREKIGLWLILLFEGSITLIITYFLADGSSVFSIAITSVSLMAAGLAPAVAIKILGWPHSATSLTIALFVGFSSALLWKISGLSGTMNESAIGIVIGLISNYTVTLFFEKKATLTRKET
jgi:Na+/proline symporter